MVDEADWLRSVLSEVPLGPSLVASELPKPVLLQCVWARLGSEYELLERVCSLTVEHPGEFAVARSFVLLTHLRVTGDFVTRLASTVGTPGSRRSCSALTTWPGGSTPESSCAG